MRNRFGYCSDCRNRDSERCDLCHRGTWYDREDDEDE